MGTKNDVRRSEVSCTQSRWQCIVGKIRNFRYLSYVDSHFELESWLYSLYHPSIISSYVRWWYCKSPIWMFRSCPIKHPQESLLFLSSWERFLTIHVECWYTYNQRIKCKWYYLIMKIQHVISQTAALVQT